MARDPATNVIRDFGWLMVAVFICSAALACLGLWGLWHLVLWLVA
jgi:hypothetical protein